MEENVKTEDEETVKTEDCVSVGQRMRVSRAEHRDQQGR